MSDIFWKIHACCMIGGFLFCFPNGALEAKFLKAHFGLKWFKIHQAFQIIGTILFLTGFTIAVVLSSLTKDSIFRSLHTCFGLVTVICAFSTSFLGYLSNKWWSPNRQTVPRFPDKIHWIIGQVTILLGLMTIIIGINMWTFTSVTYEHIALASVCVCVIYLTLLFAFGSMIWPQVTDTPGIGAVAIQQAPHSLKERLLSSQDETIVIKDTSEESRELRADLDASVDTLLQYAAQSYKYWQVSLTLTGIATIICYVCLFL